MPMGFKRFRVLNESGTDVSQIDYSAHPDWAGDPDTAIVEAKAGPGLGLGTGEFHAFDVPGGPGGIPGVLAVRTSINMVGGPNPDVDDWLLASTWEGYEILEIEIIIDADISLMTARIFLADDYYEERFRFF